MKTLNTSMTNTTNNTVEGVVYRAFNLDTGMSYIGKTWNLKQRIAYHRNRFNVKSRVHSYFHHSIAKHGFDRFEFSVIDRVGGDKTPENDKLLIEKEIRKIAELNTKRPNGYNLTDGGDGTAGMILTDDHKRKIGEGVKRAFEDPAIIQKMRDAQKRIWADPIYIEEASKRFQGEKNPRFGAKWDDVHKQNQSNKLKGRYAGSGNPNYKHGNDLRTNCPICGKNMKEKNLQGHTKRNHK